MNLKKLTDRELLDVYTTYSPLYFPSEELKPLQTVEWLLSKEIYHAYGFYDKDQLLAYACLIQAKGQSVVLLDYYAVLEQYRSSGIGGIFLQKLAERLSDKEGLYIESEDPAFAHDSADCELRKRRIAFYERNGALRTGLLSQLFGVDYTILFLPCHSGTAWKTDWHFDRLNQIYLEMFPPKYYQRKVRITKS